MILRHNILLPQFTIYFFSQNKYAYAIGTIVFLFGPTIVSFIVEAATRLLKLAGVKNYREERKVSK